MMANAYNGEKDITLFHKVYPMKINMNVIGKFQSETDADYMHVAIRAMNALRKCVGLDPMDQAEMLTQAVSMEHAARLFFYAAKEMDSVVTFEEIQEAVLFEGPLMRVDEEDDARPLIDSYPVIFANLVMFSTLGVMDNAKKP